MDKHTKSDLQITWRRACPILEYWQMQLRSYTVRSSDCHNANIWPCGGIYLVV